MTPVWLWLEWVRVERGGIVLHIEIMQPVKIAQHEPRPEPDRSPLSDVAIDSRSMPFEVAMRGKEPAIVFKVVYSDFESVGGEFLS